MRRWFQRIHHSSPQEWLQARRIARAAEMLITTDATIDDISEACHFCDRFYFSRVFTRLRGSGPATFRRQHGLRSYQDTDRE